MGFDRLMEIFVREQEGSRGYYMNPFWNGDIEREMDETERLMRIDALGDYGPVLPGARPEHFTRSDALLLFEPPGSGNDPVYSETANYLQALDSLDPVRSRPQLPKGHISVLIDREREFARQVQRVSQRKSRQTHKSASKVEHITPWAQNDAISRLLDHTKIQNQPETHHQSTW